MRKNGSSTGVKYILYTLFVLAAVSLVLILGVGPEMPYFKLILGIFWGAIGLYFVIRLGDYWWRKREGVGFSGVDREFFVAVVDQDLGEVEALLKSDARLKISQECMDAALEQVVEVGQVPILGLLLDAGIKSEKLGKLLSKAIAENDISIVNCIISKRPEVKPVESELSLLEYAVMLDSKEMAEVCFEKGFDMGMDKALALAAEEYRYEMGRLLVRHGADRQKAIELASEGRKQDVIRFLDEYCSEKDS